MAARGWIPRNSLFISLLAGNLGRRPVRYGLPPQPGLFLKNVTVILTQPEQIDAWLRMRGEVVATCKSGSHSFRKASYASIKLGAGLGVEGDAHAGATVQNRYLARKNPAAPNRRQVHLFSAELLMQLSAGQDPIEPGSLGENITVRGVDLSSRSGPLPLRTTNQAPAPLPLSTRHIPDCSNDAVDGATLRHRTAIVWVR
jgi:hypothetical protein